VKGPHFHPIDRNRNHGGIRLSLIGGFELVQNGHVVDVPHVGRRLLVFLALQERPAPRSMVAGTLWPDTTDTRAGASLRSTLWRLSQLDGRLVDTGTQRLALGPTVSVDLEQATLKCRWLMDRSSVVPEALLTTDSIDADLLPEWDEDWLRKAQMAFRQQRLRALEALSQRLMEAGRHWEAVDVGLEAVAAEPLRESAHRTLVLAHLSDGNWAEAMRQYQAYRGLLWAELGVEPTPAFEELLTPRRSMASLAVAAPVTG
jgi:DNA-binding SARP family transcriptional activator